MSPTAPKIPDHEIIDLIGRGSYGEVWRARNVMGANRAVKVVRRAGFAEADPYEREFAAVQRFGRISRRAEGVIEILHVGRDDEGGYFFYVMELADAAEGEGVDGYVPQTLRRKLGARRKRFPDDAGLPVEECIEISLSLSRALGVLHEAGLVHRDVKPSNIVFIGGKIELADVGLVGDICDESSRVGTDGYIPPEGLGRPAADFYALGMVMYEAVTGKARSIFRRRRRRGCGVGSGGIASSFSRWCCAPARVTRRAAMRVPPTCWRTSRCCRPGAACTACGCWRSASPPCGASGSWRR